MGVYTHWYFVVNFSYLFRYSWVFHTAALDGAEGKLQGVGCGVWAANLYLHKHTALGLSPMVQAACNDFNKKMY